MILTLDLRLVPDANGSVWKIVSKMKMEMDQDEMEFKT